MTTRLGASVGRRAVNAFSDVWTVQMLLERHGRWLIPLRRVEANGVCDELTIASIERFQLRAMGMTKPTGVAWPNGLTIAALNRLAINDTPSAASGTGLSDPAKFFAAVNAPPLFTAALKPDQKAGLDAILAAAAAAKWPLSFTAYALATAYLETGHTMQPIKEYGGPSYFRKMYDIQGARPAKARELGNLTPGDGALFCGRGYVQLTGRTNYSKAGKALGVDLVADPDAAMKPEVAAAIMAQGMSAGWFTGKSMATYLPATGPATTAQFKEARRIINGQDRAGDVASYAVAFQQALKAGGWQD
jgi:hypothetical protein